MFNVKSYAKNGYMLNGSFTRKGFDWWWHSFTAINKETKEEKAFFIEFFTCNPHYAKEAPTFGQLPENKEKGIKPSYLMVKAGCWGNDARQIHRFFSMKDVKIKRCPIELRADNCYLSEDTIKANISLSKEESEAHPEYMCDYGDIYFDLKLDKKIAYNVGYGTSGIFRFNKSFEMYWHAQGMKTLYSGKVILDGVEYEVIPEKSYGYADKNWGSGFTTPWIWISSNHIFSKKENRFLDNTVFDIGGGKPKVHHISLSGKLLSAFYYEGREFEFNFSKVWTHCKTDFSYEVTDEYVIWHITQETRWAKYESEFKCKLNEMLKINYEAPDGSKRHNNLYNGGTGTGTVKLYEKVSGELKLIDELECYNVGCEAGEYDK